MARTLMVQVVTPEKILYTNEVEMVIAPTLEGEIGILPMHAPIVAILQPGELRVLHNGGRDAEWFAVSGGYLQVHQDKVIVLANDAVHASRIDVARAKRAKELAEEQLADLKANSDGGREGFDECEADLKWCQIQIEVAEKRS